MNNIAYSPKVLSYGKSLNFVFLLGIFAPIMMMAIIIIVGQLTPYYNPITDTISQMGAREQPYSIILNSSYIIYGIVIIATAYNLYKRLNHTTLVKILLILFVFHACGSICLAIFPDKMDTLGSPVTSNIVHNIFSGISYVSLVMGILLYSLSNLRHKATDLIAIIGIAVVAINLVMPFINLFSCLKEIAGLLQRFFMFCSFFWVTLTSALLYRRMLSNQTAGSTNFDKPAPFSTHL